MFVTSRYKTDLFSTFYYLACEATIIAYCFQAN